ncbi:MAG: GYD domain-containing protein [Chloroflexi bacterium]|nr:GYD domain-containing protein [Chloroflexota bacterium]
MPLYMYQAAYTPESLAAQIKNPQDRIEVAAKPVIEAAGGKLLAAGYTFGEYDILVVIEAPDNVAVAAVAMAVAAGGAVRAAKTTPMLSGAEWVAALQKAPTITAVYRPAR